MSGKRKTIPQCHMVGDDRSIGFVWSGSTLTGAAYERAEKTTGIKREALREYAIRIFGSILHHACKQGGETVWIQARIINGRLDLEVNAPPRRKKEAA